MRTRRFGLTESIYTAIAIYGAVILLLGVGWVLNIINLVGMSFDPLTGLAVARAVGIIVAPLGAVLGYVT